MLHTLIDIFLHLPVHLNAFAGNHPLGVYGLLVAIIFMETGLVVTPFLPGDSLLFAVGALAATENSAISLPLIIPLLCLAANCGDITNYFFGRSIGPKVFAAESSLLFSRKHLLEAQAFYDRHGRKTIIIARFVPIIRTFAPFVAGVGKMAFGRFIGFSIFGGAFWVTLLTMCGYLFGGIPWVSKHFEIVVLAIVFISVLPIAYHALLGKKEPHGFDPLMQKPADAIAADAPDRG
jgi:membrane-associated protein